MKKIYHFPTIEVNEVLPTMLLAGSGGGDNPSQKTFSVIEADGITLYGGGGDGTPTGGGAPRSNGSGLWDE